MYSGPPLLYNSLPCNVIIFGETGVGKSSVVNLIAECKLAKTSPDANACTFKSKGYPVVFDSNRPFWIWDTVGLNESKISHETYLRVVKQAYKLVKELEHSGGVHLLMCMRGRITEPVKQNCNLFAKVLCEKHMPLCVVVAHLKNEPQMEGRWTTNEEVFRRYSIFTNGHACITANPESGEMLRKLLLGLDLQLSKGGWKKEARTWLNDLFLRNRHSGQPTTEELTKKQYGFTGKEAINIATSIGTIRDSDGDGLDPNEVAPRRSGSSEDTLY